MDYISQDHSNNDVGVLLMDIVLDAWCSNDIDCTDESVAKAVAKGLIEAWWDFEIENTGSWDPIQWFFWD